jgi:two-component system, cell cycle sensor histidine kinase and response regulator CckA
MLAGSLMLGLRNAELVDHLSSEKDKAEELNVELRAEIKHREETEAALRVSQEQLIQSQKMEAVGQLAGGIAHDFNNLLQVIGGYSQLAVKDVSLSADGRRQVQQIKDASDRARALTMKLLAFSRRQVMQSDVLDLNGVVERVAPMLGRLIGENIELRTSLASNLGRVLGDGVQIEQVLLNLAVNAKDAMPMGGRITIETKNVDLDDAFVSSHRGAQTGRYVCLRVADTGHGMDADTLRHIFEPFFTTKEVGRGTGLGLAVVYGIVKQSSGYIEVESTPGKGAAFTIYLPRSQDAAIKIDMPVELGETPRGKETVLVVEDEFGVRELIAEVLHHQGYTVLKATDGEDGLHTAMKASPPVSLLLTDLVMPRMGGRELAHRLRARQPTIKVIYMSGYEAGHGRPHILDPDIPHLQKPFGPDMLARKVREVLDGA